MSGFVTIIKKTWVLFTEKGLKLNKGKLLKSQGFFVKQFRILSLAIKGFNEDNCLMKATALTFYSLFSIVPILALIFAISKGFGYDKMLQQQIKANYSEYSTILDNAFAYANSMLDNAKGGVIAGLGVVLLLWSVMKLLVSIENSFNEIWEIKKGRTWIRKITDYLTIVMVGPIFIIVAGGLTVAIQTQISQFQFLSSFTVIIIEMIAFLMVALVFTFLYMILPNTKVKFQAAFPAGIIAMILFQLVQWGYVKFQIGASGLNAIYGGFAALPLFLIWVQYSWYIVLFGAELAFANQNIDHYELENEISKLNAKYKKSIALLIANMVTKRFHNGETALSAGEIADKINLPLRLVRNILNEFTSTGIFIEVKVDEKQEVLFQPAITESKLTVKAILQSIEEHGLSSLPLKESHELKAINQLLEKIEKSMDNQYSNIPVKDIA